MAGSAFHLHELVQDELCYSGIEAREKGYIVYVFTYPL